VRAGPTDVGLVAPSPRLGHLGEDLFEQSGDDLELMPTDPIVGLVRGATVFGHLEERIRSFRPPPLQWKRVPLLDELTRSSNYGTQLARVRFRLGDHTSAQINRQRPAGRKFMA
jgi:hypothetical protein